ncbi:MAG TPA: putative lipid II flippase FtsW [Solirubrobacterales bacterium]
MTAATVTRARGLLKRGPRTRRGAAPVEYSVLLTATLCLVAFGVVMVFSASSTTSLLGESGDSAYYLKRTVIFGAVGLIALKLLSMRGVAIVRPLTAPLLGVGFFLLVVVHLPGIGVEANGATRWISFGFVQVQPAEIMKIALILYGAHLFATRPKITGELRTLMPYLAVVGAAAALIVFEPDLGTAMIATFSVGMLLIAAGVPMRQIGLIAAVCAGVVLLMIMIEPYRMERLTGFLNPGADAEGVGFQGTQASIALGSGGLFGVGLGESVQKAFYLPEAHTDMIAAVIGEELGLVGIALLVGLFGLFGWAGFRTAQRAKDRYHKLLASGLTAMILVQATLNLFAVLGLAPLTGVPLPFVSYGNSSLLVMLASVGLLLNIAGGRAAASPKAKPASRSRAKPKPASRAKPKPRRAPARRDARLRPIEGGRGRSDAKRANGRGGGGRDSRPRRAGAGRRRRAAG